MHLRLIKNHLTLKFMGWQPNPDDPQISKECFSAPNIAPPSGYWDRKLTPTNFFHVVIGLFTVTVRQQRLQEAKHNNTVCHLKQTSYCVFPGSLRTQLEKNIRKKKLFIVWQLDYETVWSPVWLQFSSATVPLMSDAADAAFRFRVKTQKMLIWLFFCFP